MFRSIFQRISLRTLLALCCGLIMTSPILHAQTNAEVVGQIFSNRSTLGYNLLMTNTNEVNTSDLTMYSLSSSLSLLHHGGQHNSEANNSQLRFSNDFIISSYSKDFMRFKPTGRIGIGTSSPGGRLSVQGVQGDDVLASFLASGTGHSIFEIGNDSTAGVNISYPNVTFNVRGAGGDVSWFAVENPSGGLLLDMPSSGNLEVTNNVNKGGGAFKIDHPLDPSNKYLYHSFVESPDMMNIYNGNIITDQNGIATVELPNYFQALNRDYRYQLTVIGSFAQAIIKQKINNGKFIIQTDKPQIEVSWQVTGIRQDAYANENRIVPEVEKANIEKGYYLHAKAYGLEYRKSINYLRRKASESSSRIARSKGEFEH